MTCICLLFASRLTAGTDRWPPTTQNSRIAHADTASLGRSQEVAMMAATGVPAATSTSQRTAVLVCVSAHVSVRR